MKCYYRGSIYESFNYQDDTVTNDENNELVKLGLIFGQPILNGIGIEVTYNGTKIIITPSNFKKPIKPIPRFKKDRKFEYVPAYTITAGKSGATVLKNEANRVLRNLKTKLDSMKGPLEEGFFSTMLSVASDSTLKGMGFGELPGQAVDTIEEKDNANRKET